MKLIKILNQFESIDCTKYAKMCFETSSESKFILNARKLKKVLNEVKDQYHILEIKEKRILKYTNEYFDTEDYKLYHAHHNGNSNRYLIKNNKVEGSKSHSFEIKHESNKGEVNKLKHKSKNEVQAEQKINELIQENTPFQPIDLKKTLKNQFYRIVLIHKKMGEKITINLNLELSNLTDKIILPYLAIVEIRQTKFSLSSDFVLSLRKRNIQKTSLNKYCIGIALLNKDVKKNKFKSKLLAINKINEDTSYLEHTITA